MEDLDDFRIFIGKIPSNVPTDKIEKYFGQFGAIANVLAPRSNGPFKIAFVTYADQLGLEKALGARHELAGNELNVTKALPKSSRGPVPVYDTKKETRIFAGQLPAGTSEEELEGYFSKWGKVTKVFIPVQPVTDKMYAFITFSSSQEKFAALSSRHQFKGVDIKVVEATPKTGGPSNRGGGGGGAGAGAGGGLYGGSPFAARGGLQYPGLPSAVSPPSQPEFEDNPTRIFVGRIPADTSSEELKDYFGRFGTVVDVHLPSARSKTPKQEAKGHYAFVTFSNSKELFKTLANAPHTLRDQRIEVIEAKPKGVRGSAEAPSQIEPRLFVGRIPAEVSDDVLRQHFGQFGKVVDVHRTKQTSKDGLAISFVIFSNSQDVARALAEDRHVLLGKELNVVRARPRGQPGSGGEKKGRSGSRDASRGSFRDAGGEYGRDPREARGQAVTPAAYPFPESAYDPYRTAAPVYENPYLPPQPQPAYVSNGGYAAVAQPQALYQQHYDPYGSQAYGPAPSALSAGPKHRFSPY